MIAMGRSNMYWIADMGATYHRPFLFSVFDGLSEILLFFFLSVLLQNVLNLETGENREMICFDGLLGMRAVRGEVRHTPPGL